MACSVIEACAYLGLAWTTAVVLRFCMNFHRNVTRPVLRRYGIWALQDRPEQAGRWAVITGATDGIGKAYAMNLAARGMDIVLISRNADKLQQTAKEIKLRHGVEVRAIAVDFTGGLDIYSEIRRELVDLDIGVLVNNVGTAYKFYEYFTRIPDGDQLMENLFKLNILSYCIMSRLVLTKMCAKRKGVIINVGSASALFKVPFLSAYAASKVFGHYLSQALHQEYQQFGIHIQLVTPYYVVSNLSHMKRVTLSTPSPDIFVRWAMLSYSLDPWLVAYPVHFLIVAFLCISNFLMQTFFWWDTEFFFAYRFKQYFHRKHKLL